MSAPLDEVLGRAVAQNLLPPGTALHDDERPWPIVIITAIGAWIAAIPLCVLIALMFGGLLDTPPATYFVGVVVLAAALVVLQSDQTPLFVEQLAIPGALVGGGLIAFSFFRDLPTGGAAFLSAALALGCAALVPMAWLRALLGILAAQLAGFALVAAATHRWYEPNILAAWWALHALLVVWIAAMVLQSASAARVAVAIEAVGAGWLLVVLGGLAWLTGATFLAGSLGAPMSSAMSRMHVGAEMGVVSVALAAGACFWLARQWPGLRHPALLAVPAVALPLAWMMPALGGVLLATALCAAASRWRLASFGALAAAWIIGAFYYQLSWTLVMKAYVMVLAGLALGAAAWHLRGVSSRDGPAEAREVPWRVPPVLVAVAVVATLLVANVGIWQKQHLIASGRVVLVPLAPADPRSLMQGDYMTLNFIPFPAGAERDARPAAGDAAPVVVMALDDRGVATPVRTERAGQVAALAPNEVRMRLVARRGDWMLVTDAWHFAEGQADRFATARFGEFRVTDDGRALLVGLRDADLRPLNP